LLFKRFIILEDDMSSKIIHALVLIQTWGDSAEILNVLKYNRNIISIFHIMGRYSFLVDANFDEIAHLEKWINQMKSLKLSSGVPVILQMQTQRIIEVHKQKADFTLSQYLAIKGREHFFIKIDAPRYDEALIKLLKESPSVYSLLHVQGENSFTIEIIVDDYDEYKKLLFSMKHFDVITHIETQEVLAVLKYRNQIIDENGALIYSSQDNRELYTL
jgi:hypothetical protein